VTLKRANNGSDKAFTKPVNAPEPLVDPALTVHEGTLEEAGMKPDSAQKIDAILTEWAANDKQAFAVCVVRNGVIVLHKAYGQRDGKPMTVATKSWMASITKLMSAACMLMLADRKLVNLDAPLDRYLPLLRDIKVEQPLTIRHLYTHTAGLSKWPGEWGSDELPDIEWRIALAYPLLKVGKEWAFNSPSYTLGGKIIENVSGEAMPRFYLNHLLGPLGMTNTDVTGTHADAQSVPLDMAKFGQMLLNKGSYGTMRFFKPEAFEKEMLPHKLTYLLGDQATKVFGFGLDGTPEKFGHDAASAATFSVDVNEKLIVVMTRDKRGKAYDKYMGKFLDAIAAGIEKK
jgi:CubicO group peptidase (beta-lactamase class C family)